MYGYRKSRSVIAALVAGLCTALFSVSSLAITIDVGRSPSGTWGVDGFNHTSSGINGRQGQTVRMPPLNTSLNVTRNAVVPYNSLANGMRNFVRITPGSLAASAAVTGLFLAMDWAFEQGQWQKTGYETISEDLGGYYWYRNGSPEPKFSDPSDLCNFYGTTLFPSWNLESSWFTPNPNGTSGICSGRFTYQGGAPFEYTIINATRGGDGCPEPYIYIPSISMCAIEGFVPLDDGDFSDLAGYLPSASPDQVGSAGQDTQRLIGGPLPGYSDQTITGPSSISGDTTTTTTTDPSTGQSTITETSTTTNISYGDTTITTTTTTTTTNYNSDGSVQSETVTETTPGQEVVSGTASDWPGFCDWATVVCDWLDWTKEGWPEEEPELPQVVDFTPDGDFQVGGPGACPAPYVLSIGWLINQDFQVSYQPFCDLALIVNPLLLAFCYLIAGVLTVRSL